MSSVSQVTDNVATYSGAAADTNAAKTSKNTKTENTGNTGKTKVSGKTIGSPELSKKASEYYEKLKNKYSNMDFILVSADKKEQAKAQASNYANANKMVVLIDEDKIERMADDENYRRQYEGIIANAASGISQLKSSLASTGAAVKGYGMQVNDDGTASYFAVLEKSSKAQKERIEKKAAQKKEAKKAEARKAAKKEKEEKLKEASKEKKAEESKDSDTVTITASSIDDLIKKVQDQLQMFKSDDVLTESEKKVGQKFDFSI